MKTLKLFNSVVEKKSNKSSFISSDGYIIEPNSIWAKDMIINYYSKEKLNGNDLNKTFHKSWKKIKNSSRFELLIEQIRHYISTYGTEFKSEIYIPNEVLNIPELKLKYKIIKGIPKKDMINKCLLLLRSGIALNEETINDLITILVDELDYVFTGDEGIKNKEAIVKIAEDYGIYPSNPVEFFRYVIYKTTNTTLLIKNNNLINLIKDSSYNPSRLFKDFGLKNLGEIFNRFKPLFLGYKKKCPKTINKISKLSKIYHKPLVGNPLNSVTQNILLDKDIKWLDNATPFALFKAISACYNRIEGQSSFVYLIRNGKSWITQKKANKVVNKKNYVFLLKYIKNRFDLSDKKIFIPDDIKYALPTSEKLFVGNFPCGTKFYGKKLAVGIYWENKWGADDLDISGINIGGKVGWNSIYNQNDGNLMFSGDITNAPNGAVEYLYANNGLNVPTLVNNNIYSGRSDCDYKIIIGKGDNINRNMMMNPNNLFAEIKTKSIQNDTILGILLPEKNRQSFSILNFGAGNCRVSGNSNLSDIATKALYEQWHNPLSLNDFVVELGAKITTDNENSDIDLSLDRLERDTIINIFNK